MSLKAIDNYDVLNISYLYKADKMHYFDSSPRPHILKINMNKHYSFVTFSIAFSVLVMDKTLHQYCNLKQDSSFRCTECKIIRKACTIN